MTESIDQAKARLRREIRERLKTLPEQQRAEASREICCRLRAQPFWQAAGAILFYAPLPAEPDIWPLLLESLEPGKMVCLPRYSPQTGTYWPARISNPLNDLTLGPLGTREPSARCELVPLAHVDLVLVPGLAFDRQGHRLGRGKGHYDRMLAGFDGLTCGVAFEEQVVESIPSRDHDIAVRALVTPKRLLWFSTEKTKPAASAGLV